MRAGLRICEALALAEADLDPRRGSLLVRRGKGGRRREVGVDDWAREQLEPWLQARFELPVGPLFCCMQQSALATLASAAERERKLRASASTSPTSPDCARPQWVSGCLLGGPARGAYVGAVLPFVVIPVAALIVGQIAAAASCWVAADRRRPTEPPANRLSWVSMAAAAGLVLLAVVALVDGMGATAATCSDLDEAVLREHATWVTGCAGVAAGLAFAIARRSTSWRRGHSWLLAAEVLAGGFAVFVIVGHVLLATCGL